VMTEKVYLLTAGEYSDYQVLAVCRTRELAEFLAKRVGKHKREEVRVEEYPLVKSVDEFIPLTIYFVRIDTEGNEVHRRTYHEMFFGEAAPDDIESLGWPTSADATGAFGCSSRGYDAALKAARDKLAEFKAQKAGL